MNDFGTPLPSNLPTTSSFKPRGEDFTQIFEADFDQANKRIVMGAGVSDRMRHERVMDTHRTMHKTGWEKATVINMHSFEIRHGMGNIGEVRIPPKKAGEPYSKFTILRYRISIRDLGDAKFVPEVVLPVQIAEDVCLIASEWGGVFWYRGDGDPSPEELEAAGKAQFEYFKREFVKGEDSWHKVRQISLINEHMKNAAKELYRSGALEKLPEWCTITKNESLRKACDACGEDIKNTAKRCSYCGFIIDVEFFKANQDRFSNVEGKAKQGLNPLSKVDESQKSIDTYFEQDDPDAGKLQKKIEDATDAKLPKDLIPPTKDKKSK